MKARGKFVATYAAAKFSQFIGFGQARPVPVPIWSGDFRAMATVKYSGSRTVREATSISAVSHQLTL